MTRCKNQPAKLKDIIGSFTPFLIAVLAQYVLNFIDIAILFFKNMHSDYINEINYHNISLEVWCDGKKVDLNKLESII